MTDGIDIRIGGDELLLAVGTLVDGSLTVEETFAMLGVDAEHLSPEARPMRLRDLSDFGNSET